MAYRGSNIIFDPDRIEAFLMSLKQLRSALSNDWERLDQRWQECDESWDDHQRDVFAGQIGGTMVGWDQVRSMMTGFLADVDSYEDFLRKLWEAGDAYRSVRPRG